MQNEVVWTIDVPEDPGYYWVRDSRDLQQHLVCFIDGNISYCFPNAHSVEAEKSANLEWWPVPVPIPNSETMDKYIESGAFKRKPNSLGVDEEKLRLAVAGVKSVSFSSRVDLDTFQHLYGKWALAQFPNQSLDSVATHFREEAGEFAGWVDNCGDLQPASHDPEEAADCVLLLLAHAKMSGYSLMEYVIRKAHRNVNRVWEEKDGNFRHRQ